MNSLGYTDVSASEFRFPNVRRKKQNAKPRSNRPVTSILSSVPRTYRVEGRKLVELRKRTPQISWSPTGEVSIRGKIIPNSNISELVNDILRHRQRASPPTGWQSFIEALVKDIIPEISLVIYKENHTLNDESR